KENHAVIAMIARAFVCQNPFDIWGTGEQIRNWTFVDDIVEGTILAAEKIDDGTAVNLGTMERVRVLDAARMILEITGVQSEIITNPDMPTGPLNRVADNSLAKELLGWEPKVSFRDGLERTINWYYASKNRENVRKILIEGGLIVVFVLVLLLGNFRAGLIVASVIPLSMLFAFGMMSVSGVSANLMSLGALDFGLVVDGAVVIVEGVIHQMHIRYAGQRLSRDVMDQTVSRYSGRMMQTAIFGQVIILIVYIPILALVGIEGKMFKPMAMTVSFAIIGAIILSLTYVPMATSLFLNKNVRVKQTFSDRFMHVLEKAFMPVLAWVIRFKYLMVSISLGVFIISLWLFTLLGSVFIPNLEEGD
ncbi:MAG: efflux RND transporter permease subunit, partial [Flavobacteriales bacterium]|nr:efflux RND transporter permease subunit [Flavobacteriales bacterium]